MKNIFNYTYYRIAKFYFKRDGSDAITALLTITLIISLYIIDLIVLCMDLLQILGRGKLPVYIKIAILGFTFSVYLFVRKIYLGKYFIYRETWIVEDKQIKRLNGLLVILFILSPMILLFLIASFFGRTNF